MILRVELGEARNAAAQALVKHQIWAMGEAFMLFSFSIGLSVSIDVGVLAVAAVSIGFLEILRRRARREHQDMQRYITELTEAPSSGG